MRKLLLALFAGLVGAAALHIVIVLLVPYFAVHDVWSQIREMETDGSFVSVVNLPGAETLRNGENVPRVETRICRFEITRRPVRLSASGTVPFWSIGVFDRQSNELFSINDRTVEGQELDVALALSGQMVTLRKEVPPALQDSVLVEVPEAEGYVMLRSVVPNASWQGSIAAFLDSARCEPLASR